MPASTAHSTEFATLRALPDRALSGLCWKTPIDSRLSRVIFPSYCSWRLKEPSVRLFQQRCGSELGKAMARIDFASILPSRRVTSALMDRQTIARVSVGTGHCTRSCLSLDRSPAMGRSEAHGAAQQSQPRHRPHGLQRMA